VFIIIMFLAGGGVFVIVCNGECVLLLLHSQFLSHFVLLLLLQLLLLRFLLLRVAYFELCQSLFDECCRVGVEPCSFSRFVVVDEEMGELRMLAEVLEGGALEENVVRRFLLPWRCLRGVDLPRACDDEGCCCRVRGADVASDGVDRELAFALNARAAGVDAATRLLLILILLLLLLHQTDQRKGDVVPQRWITFEGCCKTRRVQDALPSCDDVARAQCLGHSWVEPADADLPCCRRCC
jgi:hypothetical protein